MITASSRNPTRHDSTVVTKPPTKGPTAAAIANAVSPPAAADVRALAERREDAANAYYGGA